MALLGTHVSSAGSILKTFERANSVSAEVFQFFLRSPRVWNWKGVSEEDRLEFKRRAENFGNAIMVHSPYLLNLASADPKLRQRSIEVFLEELKFCDESGIDFYNFHPGTAKGISEKEAILNIVASLEEILKRYTPKNTCILLENTAGERGDIGKNFKELESILRIFDGVKMGVCLDTCHAFASGYEINTPKGFYNFKKEIEKTIGLESIKAVHCNDSKMPLGSRRDRHEHIGLGFIGLDGFRNLLRDEYFSLLPYYLETPKVDDWDRVNLKILRCLME
jgi:deoxyribonuclease-4